MDFRKIYYTETIRGIILKYFVKSLLPQDLLTHLTQELFVRNSGLQDGDNLLLDLMVPFPKSVVLHNGVCK
jgi:hypothetical protein